MEAPSGLKYSLLYTDRSAPQSDSARFRVRIAAYFRYWLQIDRDGLGRELKIRVGCSIPNDGFDYDYDYFFEHSGILDVLDSITIIFQVLLEGRLSTQAKEWRDFISLVFKEENLSYRLDDECGVHYSVDQEFERNRVATLQGLTSQEHAPVRAAYEDAYRHLDNHPPDTGAAVWSLFKSIEILVKAITGASLLNKRVVEGQLKDFCIKAYSNDSVASDSLDKLFNGFGHWVNAAHNYRHGQVGDKPVAPPMDLAVYLLSSGSAYLRWLLDLKGQVEASEP